jgi:hypothetical protein
LAIFLGYVIAPCFQILLWEALSLKATLFVFFLFSLVGLFFSLKLQSFPSNQKQQELEER